MPVVSGRQEFADWHQLVTQRGVIAQRAWNKFRFGVPPVYRRAPVTEYLSQKKFSRHVTHGMVFSKRLVMVAFVEDEHGPALYLH